MPATASEAHGARVLRIGGHDARLGMVVGRRASDKGEDVRERRKAARGHSFAPAEVEARFFRHAEQTQ